MRENTSNVVLPGWIWREARNEEDIDRLILKYMQRYPDYEVKEVKGHIAICEINKI